MSIIVTAVGSVSSVLLTSMLSYAIARKGLPGRKLLTFFVFFTMLFNGGLVPTYIMYINTFHIKNTIFALLIPSLLIHAFNVMLMRSYLMTSIPNEIIESASIDGASEFTIFGKVVMPMSIPIIATIFLYQVISYWNDWKNGLFYITSRTDLYTIQNLLNRMIMNIQYLASASDTVSSDLSNIPTVTVRMAIAVAGLIPILIIYPFIQKYFVRGIVLGAVKG
jgi:putative aldouronate transport system permease protein